ncbi:MAG: universal stress protein [Dactylosporangium sp.]|nr:universal stress protein [Dactylosporangium sp.]NNJ62531.1 universal stress protein [Dactylosporangium sp.]
MEDDRKPVIVGIDGSESSRGALHWAAGEAVARDRPLRIIHAAGPAEPELWSAARAMVADAVSAARSWRPELAVSGEVIDGQPVVELCSASPDAELVVIAARGIGGFDGLLLGSVAAEVALHAQSAVTVVHNASAWVDRAPDAVSDLPVLVGADSSHESAKAIGVAFEEAHLHGLPVLAVRAWHPPVVAYRGKVQHSTISHEIVETAAGHTVLEAVADWRAKYPEVAFSTSIVAGSAAGALVEASTSAQLIVVGSRGHSSIPGLRLGATISQLLQHARCPVMIVREPRDEG